MSKEQCLISTLAGDSADCESGDALLKHNNKNNSPAPDA